ncbi:MAG: metal-sensing transcriptional repressor [Steroidobacteraceae bacterium]
MRIHKGKLRIRLRRLRGKVEAIEHAVQADRECADVTSRCGRRTHRYCSPIP